MDVGELLARRELDRRNALLNAEACHVELLDAPDDLDAVMPLLIGQHPAGFARHDERVALLVRPLAARLAPDLQSWLPNSFLDHAVGAVDRVRAYAGRAPAPFLRSDVLLRRHRPFGVGPCCRSRVQSTVCAACLTYGRAAELPGTAGRHDPSRRLGRDWSGLSFTYVTAGRCPAIASLPG